MEVIFSAPMNPSRAPRYAAYLTALAFQMHSTAVTHHFPHTSPQAAIKQSNGTPTPNSATRTAEQVQAALAEWEGAFEEEKREGGAFAGTVGPIHPSTVLNELRRAREAESAATIELAALRQRLAASAAESAARARDDVALRKELHAARAAGEPRVLQLRQLLIEPAVNREFGRLAEGLQEAQREAAALRDEMRAMHVSGAHLNPISLSSLHGRVYQALSWRSMSFCRFLYPRAFSCYLNANSNADVSPSMCLFLQFAANDPKGPRALAAQIKTLEDRCEALSAQAQQSRAAQLQQTLAMAQSQLEDMRKMYGELEDHAHALDDEAELMQKELLALRRAAAGGGPSAGPGPGHGGAPPMHGPFGGDGRRRSPGPGYGGGGRGSGPPPPAGFFRGPPPPQSAMGKRPRY